VVDAAYRVQPVSIENVVSRRARLDETLCVSES